MKDSLTYHPSSQGWAPGVQTFLYKCFVVSCMYLDGGMGGRRVATSLLSFLLLGRAWASLSEPQLVLSTPSLA